LEPFPEQYLGTFDVVHVRLLVLALTVEQVGVAAGNLVRLLSTSFYLITSSPIWILNLEWNLGCLNWDGLLIAGDI
jgi:hypothetical protein